MTIQIIAADEKTIINLNSAMVVSDDDQNISILAKIGSLTEKEIELFDSEGLTVSTNPENDNIKTVDHFITTSQKDNGTSSSLEAGQWLIVFEKA